MSEFDGLEELLADAFETFDPVPADLKATAAGLSDWIHPDASLAVLVARESVALRSPAISQSEFAWPEFSMSVQWAFSNGRLSILGMFPEAAPDSILVQGPHRTSVEASLVRGSFELDTEGDSPFRISFSVEGQEFVTPWIEPTTGSS